MPLRPLFEKLYYFGNRRYCPICDSSFRKFGAFGRVALRQDVRCPRCRSVERDRLAWLVLQSQTMIKAGMRMLHFAPERCLRARFRAELGEGYVTADLFAQNVDLKLDITSIDLPDAGFDLLYCSHVLEHVPDDLRAMRELRRMLKPDGIAFLNVPIYGDVTYEDFSITDPKAREQAFGQDDHVRKYGMDFVDRLRTAGFAVQIVSAQDLASEAEIERLRMGPPNRSLFVCRHAT